MQALPPRLCRFERDEKGCWLWTGSVWRTGRPRHRTPAGWVIAYREIYRLLRGPIPEGLVLDHLCRVKECVNPEHLEPVTQQENLRRMYGTGFAAPLPASTILTADQAVAIFRTAAPQRELADQYGVSRSTISMIKCGKHWARYTAAQVSA